MSGTAYSIELCMKNNEARYLQHHGFGRSTDGYIMMSPSMTPLLVEDPWMEEFDGLDAIPYTVGNIEHIMQIYIQAVYFEHWYCEAADVFTIRSEFYPLDVTEEAEDITWQEPKFVRLNSVSPKRREPVFSLRVARQVIAQSPRCQESIAVANHYGFENWIVIRDWKDLSDGNEYRTFVYHDRLTAITNHDDHGHQILAEKELVSRVQSLLDKAKHHMPHTTICMDVFIHNTHQGEDCVIEFSAYGAATDTGSGSFHWLTDAWVLADASEVTVRLD